MRYKSIQIKNKINHINIRENNRGQSTGHVQGPALHQCILEAGVGKTSDGLKTTHLKINKCNLINLGICIAHTQPYWVALGA
jgi:hypothetical protein